MNKMKYLIGIFIVFICILLSCQKEESIFDELGFYGEASANINGMEWKGKTGIFPNIDPQYRNCLPDTCINILMKHFNEEGLLRSELYLNFTLSEKEKYILNPIPTENLDTLPSFTYSEYISDGDVVSGFYTQVLPDTSSYLEITKLNRTNWDISGRFNARVVKIPLLVPAGEVPDTIEIDNGTFYGRINWDK